MNTIRRGSFTAAALATAVLCAAGTPARAAGGWHQVPSPGTGPGTYAALDAVYVAGHTDAWAFGQQGVPGTYPFHTLAERWTGSTWAITPTAALPRKDAASFYAAAGTGPDDVWAVGSTAAPNGPGHSLIEHWNGTAWTQAPATPGEPPGGSLESVSADSPGDVWAVGTTNPGGGAGYSPLIEHFNGTAWQVVAGVTTDVTILSSVAAVSPHDVWVLGAYGVTDAEPVIEHFNGHTWAKVPEPVHAVNTALIAVAAAGPASVWAVGEDDNTTLTEHWNGTRWTVVTSPDGPGDNELTSITALSGNDIWAAGATGGSFEQNLIEHWNGTKWELAPTPDPGGSRQTDAISGLASGPLFAAGTMRGKNAGNARAMILQH
jgi:hypothetical protein